MRLSENLNLVNLRKILVIRANYPGNCNLEFDPRAVRNNHMAYPDKKVNPRKYMIHTLSYKLVLYTFSVNFK